MYGTIEVRLGDLMKAVIRLSKKDLNGDVAKVRVYVHPEYLMLNIEGVGCAVLTPPDAKEASHFSVTEPL